MQEGEFDEETPNMLLFQEERERRKNMRESTWHFHPMRVSGTLTFSMRTTEKGVKYSLLYIMLW